ncbi:MAG TPA: hypothetical protein PLO44_02045 [Candidatus Paceibacterota bacterium]|nr:hypothetical protein [Candidatus Paceibacterota bacterium]
MIEQILKPKFNIEVRENGDVYIVSGEKEDLIEFAMKVGKALDDSNFSYRIEETKESLRQGKDQRPGGCFGLSIIKMGGKEVLMIDNRNARGYKPMTDQLGEAIKKAKLESNL